jgi:hypothetical protein
LKTDFGGLPIAFHLTGGEASDSRNFETLLDIGPDTNTNQAVIPAIKMIIGDWYVDELGIPTREITARD